MNAARQRRDHGDPLPFMLILKQERDKRGVVLPVGKSRRGVETVRSPLL